VFIELRDRVRHALLIELFGDGFRADKPVETLGGRLKQLLDLKDVDRFRQVQGEVKGLMRGLELVDEQIRRLM
jgi:hypothetical protein